jgi:protein involved in polysaccharide export with SLBB domain
MSVCIGLRLAAAETTETNAAAPVLGAVAMDMLDDRQVLGPGDRISYRVIEDKDEVRSLTIADSGELEVPYYGLVHAADKTSRQLALEIKILLERRLYYRATVILAVESVNRARVSGKVYVTGQVRNQGGLEIPDGEAFTVSKAILKAGGFSDFSNKKRVRLIRKTDGEKRTFIINVVDIWQKGRLEEDMAVQPDDWIVVPERLFNW